MRTFWRWPPTGLIAVAAGLMLACGSATSAAHLGGSSPAALCASPGHQNAGNIAKLGIYEWAPDPEASGWAFRPIDIGLGGAHVVSSVVRRSPEQGSPEFVVTFDAKGRALLEQATQHAFKASGQLDETNHLAWFIGLTAADLAGWDQSGSPLKLLGQWPQEGKLFSDPMSASVVTSGQVGLALTAAELAPACSLATASG